jgi:putative membrane-bound dehydrogenase-like protein
MRSTFTFLSFSALLFSIVWGISKTKEGCSPYRNPKSTGDTSRLYAPDDLEVTLWAEAPMFNNPTNLDVDARGRIWVTEAVNYRDFNTKPAERLSHRPKGDRVVILEDTDGDGQADHAKVYVEDTLLTAPLGIAVIGNKVIVSCAPNLLIYTDDDGDDKPDRREVFLTGFGGFDHDHSLHALVAGPDGLWYFNTGNAGPHTVKDKSGWMLRSGSLYTGGTPYNKKNEGNLKSDDGRVWVGGLALRINPDGTGLKVMGHNFRNSYEVCMDSYGNRWQNDNDDQVITCRTSYLPENGNAGYFSSDGTRYWQADRRPGQDIFTAHWHQEDPGVMPAGDNTGAGSPTGIMFYEGDALGAKYRGTLLSCEAGRNVIFSYKPVKNGAGFDLNRKDLISSFPQASERYEWFETDTDTRKWFRPSDIVAGTDGALYVADWYDPIVGGHAMKDKKGYGRIFRITPTGKKLVSPKFDFTTTKGLIEGLKSPAIHVRAVAFDMLKRRGDVVIAPVQKLLKSENPYHAARATWLLAQLGEKGRAEVEKLLTHQDAMVRLNAYRALRVVSGDVLPYAKQLVTDPDPAVHAEVAVSMRDIPIALSKEIIRELLKRYDGKDLWLLDAIGSASEHKEEQVYAMAKEIYPGEANAWTIQRANLAWRLHPQTAINDLRIRAGSVILTESERKKSLTAIAFIHDKKAATAMVALSKSKLPDVSSLALWWLDFRKTNDWAALVDWKKNDATVVIPVNQKMLTLKKNLSDQAQSLHARISAAKQMAVDPSGGDMLIEMRVQGKLSDTIAKSVSDLIFRNPSQHVRTVGSQFFPRNGKVMKVDFINRMSANKDSGSKLFLSNCAVCHRHGENGGEIGPDLTSIHEKFDKTSLLDAIINPSANIVFGYEAYAITTKKGESFFGFLLSDGSNVVLKDGVGTKHVIKVTDIKTREKLPNSFMPEPINLSLDEQALADITGYLLSFKK